MPLEPRTTQVIKDEDESQEHFAMRYIKEAMLDKERRYVSTMVGENDKKQEIINARLRVFDDIIAWVEGYLLGLEQKEKNGIDIYDKYADYIMQIVIDANNAPNNRNGRNYLLKKAKDSIKDILKYFPNDNRDI